jgi:hypothetical protein
VRVTSEGQSSESEDEGEGSGVVATEVATDVLPAFLIVDKVIAVDAVFLLLALLALALLWAATEVEDCLTLEAAADFDVVFKVVGT